MDGNGAADRGRGARLREALTSGHNTLETDRAAAVELQKRWPWAGTAVIHARAFHRHAAEDAVTRSAPAAGVIFACAGYPPASRHLAAADRPLHALAARAAPGTVFGYADADPKVTAVTAGVLAAGSRGMVSAWTADEAVPEDVLGSPAAARMLAAGPVHVGAVLCAHYWVPCNVQAVVAAYARLLPPGSTLALSLPAADPGWADTEEWVKACSRAIGRQMYLHTPADLLRWIAEADMDLHPWGVRDAAVWGRPSAIGGDGLPWAMTATGIVK